MQRNHVFSANGAVQHRHFVSSREEAERYMALLQRNQLAFDLSQQGDLQEAEQTYRDILRDKPAASFGKVSIALTKTELGRILRKLGRFDEALPMLRQALVVREQFDRESGDDSVTCEEIAKVYEAIGNCERPLKMRTPGTRICVNEPCKARVYVNGLHCCSRCKCVFYCCKTCQRGDWTHYKPLCQPRAPAAAH